MKQRVSSAFLKKEAAKYQSLNKKKFTNSRYNQKRRLEDDAEKLLNKLCAGELDVQTDDVKAYVSYINAFSSSERRDEDLTKLQQYADFDVKAYAENQDKSFKEKLLALFKPSPEKIKYLSASQMKRRSDKYRKLCRRVNKNPWGNNAAYERSRALRHEAQKYAAAVASEKVTVKPEDGREFRNYINIVCFPIDKNGVEYQAISTVSAMLRKHKELQPSATETKRPAFGSSLRNLWQKTGRKLKITAVALLAAAGALVGGKSCSKAQDNASSVPVEKIAVVKPDTAAAEPIVKNVEKKQQSDSAKVVSLQKIWNNYYDNTIEILSSAAQKQKLYSMIDKQLAAGLYVLPEDISKEKLAYSYLIYKEYGIKSSLSSALNSKEKLSAAAQRKLIEDVRKAGNKGEGVKQMAAKRNNGHLSSYSKYDKASPTLQKQHIKNLKQLMQAKKQNQAG